MFRKQTAMPIEVPTLEIKSFPLFQRITQKSKHLRELGMTQAETGCPFGVDRRAVGKPPRWLKGMAKQARGQHLSSGG